MKSVRFHALLSVLVVALLGTAAVSQAGIATYDNRTVFEALGSISYNSNFDDFSTDMSYPGNPYTRGGVTYKSDYNLIIGTGTTYTPVRNVMVNNYRWYPVKGDIDAGSQ